MNKTTIAIIISVILIVSAIFFTSNKNNGVKEKSSKQTEKIVNNVSIINGKQIIEIKAKGGYTPRKSVAQAGIPTILQINTNGTFDCSASIRIPSMNIQRNLPQSGVTDIELGTNPPGILQGSCGMGMYPFQIEFK
ncbi:TPA: hypothetical protein DIC38_01420 [Candidatus Nomurabacteria bacterium]|nr:MAG: hypothetical protein O210_OD1C00001G0449 [Parcubacteria bacterium RAAC4_OD1_1]HCY26323.1 hypothetical protein [Candidatus Nomurabacteria bacterium]